jgi:hypothetical protein
MKKNISISTNDDTSIGKHYAKFSGEKNWCEKHPSLHRVA